MDSGVPQGTVLGPLMFLLYINDIGIKLKSSSLKLFADDCLLYRTIESQEDAHALQHDLDLLEEWTKKWQMSFNSKKCYILRITRKHKPVIHNYTIDGEVLTTVLSQTYLGLTLHEHLSWEPHINNMTAKAGRTLGFIKRNLGKSPQPTKMKAYTSLVRSQLEYAAVVWDPHLDTLTKQIEMVQRRSVRFICNNYIRDASVTEMMKQTGLPTLKERRRQARLISFYQSVNGENATSFPSYIRPKERTTRSQHSHRFIRLNTHSDSYKFSFFPRTLRDWDSLPTNVIESPSVKIFKDAIRKL